MTIEAIERGDLLPLAEIEKYVGLLNGLVEGGVTIYKSFRWRQYQDFISVYTTSSADRYLLFVFISDEDMGLYRCIHENEYWGQGVLNVEGA